MNRSIVNELIRQAEAEFAKASIHLPGFARWSAADWHERPDATTLRSCGLGWDLTDFGEGDFDRTGLLLFTVRNGMPGGGAGNRPYAEKLMIARRQQLTPLHRHLVKVEDIICRAPLESGACLAVRLHRMREDGGLDEQAPVTAWLDGQAHTVAAGGVVMLQPGDSITLFPGTVHAFWGEGGDVVLGEVSTVNDDRTDNVFHPPLARFGAIEEDAMPHRLLVSDYAEFGGRHGMPGDGR